MSSSPKFDAGRAKQDLITSAADHDQLTEKIWAAMGAASAASRTDSFGPPIAQLLKSMKETHGSMRAVFTAAGRIDETDGPTGRWCDMLLLARSQYDAVFVGLLLAHDEPKYGPWYVRAGWAAFAIRHFFMVRRYRNTLTGERLRRTNILKLKKGARLAKVTVRQWVATTAELRGLALRRGATQSDAIKPLPTPGQIIQRGLLVGGRFEHLGRLLWQQWKFLCDPAHVGIAMLWARHLLRGDGDLPDDKREEFIHTYVVGQSLVPSLVAIITLITAVAAEHKSDVDLCANVIEAWKLIERGTIEGSIVWDGWARQAMGVIA